MKKKKKLFEPIKDIPVSMAMRIAIKAINDLKEIRDNGNFTYSNSDESKPLWEAARKFTKILEEEKNTDTDRKGSN